MRDLAEGGCIERAEAVLFIGECGTGKTHLLTGLCVAGRLTLHEGGPCQ
jgi:DNA replication protein DnaC